MSALTDSNGEDFPLICNICLGDNPMVRMTKLPNGHKLCKITNLPYQGFRWKAGTNGRFKETVISYGVAKDRSICQACLNDLKYGLPVGVRDTVIQDHQRKRKLADAMLPAPAISSSNIQYSQMLTNPYLVSGSEETQEFIQEKDNLVASRQLQQLAKTIPATSLSSSGNTNKTAFRNLPKLCTFWLNGTCRRVETKRCPFRPCCGTFIFPEIAGSNRELHERLKVKLTEIGPMKAQLSLDAETRNALHQALKGNKDEAIKRRVAGEDDLSKKYLGKMKSMDLSLTPPEDLSIITLYLGNLDPSTTEQDIAGVIYPFGQYTSIRILRQSNCAFIAYIDRNNAEYAASNLYNSLIINGRAVTVNWSKPKTAAGNIGQPTAPFGQYTLPPPPGMMNSFPTSYLPTIQPPYLESNSQQQGTKRQKTDK